MIWDPLDGSGIGETGTVHLERTIAIENYLIQAMEAARMMAREIARHPESCAIWIFGDICDCGIGPLQEQCETPEGE